MASLTIGGVAMTGGDHKVTRNSLVLTNALGQRDTLTFRLTSDAGAYRPVIGAPVTFTDDDANLRFGGNIRQLKVEEIGVGDLRADIGCASWEQLFDRRPTGQRTYTDKTAGFIFNDLLVNCMGGDGITSSVIAAGPTISVSFDFATVREAFDQLCALASDDANTYIWDCLPDKTARFYKHDSIAAPFDVTDTTHTVKRQGEVRIAASYNLDKYVNRVYPRLSKYIGEAREQLFAGNDTQTVFTVELPVAEKPTITKYSEVPALASETNTFNGDGFTWEFWLSTTIASLTGATINGEIDNNWTWELNGNRVVYNGASAPPAGCTIVIQFEYYSGTTTVGTEQTVGELGVETGKQWYWQKDFADITQAEGATPLATGESIKVVYKGYEDRTLDAIQNSTEIAARQSAEDNLGYYSIVLSSDAPGTFADATERAQAYLDKFSQIPCIVEYPTTDGRLRAGMSQQITIASLGLDRTFLLESVTMTQENGAWKWTVRAVSGAAAGDYKTRLREMASSGTASTVSSDVVASSDVVTVIKTDGTPVTY